MCGFLFLFLNTALSIEGDLNVTVVFWNCSNGMGFLKYHKRKPKSFSFYMDLFHSPAFKNQKKLNFLWQ